MNKLRSVFHILICISIRDYVHAIRHWCRIYDDDINYNNININNNNIDNDNNNNNNNNDNNNDDDDDDDDDINDDNGDTGNYNNYTQSITCSDDNNQTVSPLYLCN